MGGPATMAELLAHEGAVYRKQRARAPAYKQQHAVQLAEEYIDAMPVESSRRALRHRLKLYLEFCASKGAPGYPISPDMVALSLYELSKGTENKAWDSHTTALNNVRKHTADLFPKCPEATGKLMDFQPLKAFCSEARAAAKLLRDTHGPAKIYKGAAFPSRSKTKGKAKTTSAKSIDKSTTSKASGSGSATTSASTSGNRRKIVTARRRPNLNPPAGQPNMASPPLPTLIPTAQPSYAPQIVQRGWAQPPPPPHLRVELPPSQALFRGKRRRDDDLDASSRVPDDDLAYSGRSETAPTEPLPEDEWEEEPDEPDGDPDFPALPASPPHDVAPPEAPPTPPFAAVEPEEQPVSKRRKGNVKSTSPPAFPVRKSTRARKSTAAADVYDYGNKPSGQAECDPTEAGTSSRVADHSILKSATRSSAQSALQATLAAAATVKPSTQPLSIESSAKPHQQQEAMSSDSQAGIGSTLGRIASWLGF